jgi:hypothetical protein
MKRRVVHHLPVAIGFTIQWRDGEPPIEVGGTKALARRLAEAERDASVQPLTVELRSPGGASLTVGLGRLVSVATFSASAGPPYFVSSGDSGAGELLVFFRDGHWPEFDAASGIPLTAALEAAHEFVATGERPSNIAWAEV